MTRELMEVQVQVIARLSPGWWRVIVGPGVGLCDFEQDWPDSWVPVAAWRPNGEFRISGFVDGVPQVIAEHRHTEPAAAPDPAD